MLVTRGHHTCTKHTPTTMLTVAKYRVNTGKILGKGSFGIVHKALDKHGVDVAAKRIDFSAKSQKRLPQIAKDLKKLTSLKNENIARIFEVSEDEETIWVFMELCNHGDLVDYLQGSEASSSVSANEKLKLMLDIAKGVEYLHSKNVIHRDIKPSNILVAGSPATAKLTDFDCSKFLEDDYSTSVMTSNVGTMAFKAPEFYLRTVGGELYYHRNVDVFSTGLTFLAMIQNHPFLVPKLETPNEPSEVSAGYTIGMLMAERKRYKVDPLQVVKLAKEGSDSANDLWNKVRREIQKMTRVETTERASAAEVVQSLKRLTAGLKPKEWSLVGKEFSDPESTHLEYGDRASAANMPASLEELKIHVSVATGQWTIIHRRTLIKRSEVFGKSEWFLLLIFSVFNRFVGCGKTHSISCQIVRKLVTV